MKIAPIFKPSDLIDCYSSMKPLNANLFHTQLEAIESKIQAIDPVKYSASRNFHDGAVTRLSPYISRGVISTKQVFEHIKTLNLEWEKVEKLVQELAWRDYWQLVWIEKRDGIFQDLKHQQQPISNYQIPKAIVNATTGISAVDEAIKELYETGYMHNHMRMYVASICCNIAQCHWLEPAKWMYAHLLDGDLASNHLSWQWVAGAFSNKKYVANQDNINKYFNGSQKNTFLDVGYDAFEHLGIPDVLTDTVDLNVNVHLPESTHAQLDPNTSTLIYNYYNLDPYWRKEEHAQRVLLLEPSFFQNYPVHQKSLDFALELAKNVEGITLFVGEFDELAARIPLQNIRFKEHPTNAHYRGSCDQRAWMSNAKGYFPSFFAFWKKSKKDLQF